MWSYYGSKARIAKYYPKPEFNLVIEPFAGAAWYSVENQPKKVVLNDLNPVIYSIWDWLIGEATEKEITEHRKFRLGQNISSLPISEPHKNLIGFCINRGSVAPCNIVPKWSCQSKADPTFASTPFFRLTHIAKSLPQIKNWVATNKSYNEIENQEATWFIDPPYDKGGSLYKTPAINYSQLADWCKTRRGQVIVCESKGASWLDFKPLRYATGQRSTREEVVWTK